MILATVTLLFKLLEYLYLSKFYAKLSKSGEGKYSWEGKDHLITTVSVPDISTIFLLAWKAGQSKDKESVKTHVKITLKIYIGISKFLYFSSWM